MNAVAWLTPDTIRTLGWTLVHFVWQGTALAVLLYAAMALSRSALVRYWAAVSTLAIMAVCPIATFLVLERWTAPAFHGVALAAAAGAIQTIANSPAALPVSAAVSFFSVDWLSYAVTLWFVGVLIFGVRALGGWVLLERLHREKSEPFSEALRERCMNLQRRIGLSRTVRYIQSRLVDSPAAMGWFSPVVLLPVTALTGLSPEQLEAVILHELAHIKRFDAFVNLFQIAAETLLFYHPAVWWVSRSIRAERENCCDDVAVSLCGNAGDYARALTALESWRTPPSLVIAATGGSLKSRIARLLGLQTMTRSVPRAGLAAIGILCAAGALFATTFNVTVSHIADFDFTQPEPIARSFPQAAPVAPVLARSSAPEVPATKFARLAPIAENRPAVEEAQVAQSAPEPSEHTASGGSYIEGLQSAGIGNINVDDLIALKIQGVTPEYVREMRAAGLDPSVHELIAMKVQGITPDYVHEIRSTGLNPTLGDLIAMKVQGITPDYISKVRSGWKDASIHQIVAMKIQGVEPGDAAEYQKLGLKDLTLNELIAMRVQGITPDYIRAMQSAGFTNLSARDYIGAKVQGVTPEFIQKVRSHGFTNLSLHQLIELKMADVF